MTKIVLVGEAWGKDEELVGHPFVGASGVQLLKMLDQTGIMPLTGADHRWISDYYRVTGGNPHATAEIWRAHPEVFITNVFNIRPKPSNDVKNLCGVKKDAIASYPALQRGKYVLAHYASELARLFGELQQHQPNIIIALGATPAWALMKTSGIASIRGCVDKAINGMKVLPTYHPAAMLRDWSLRPIILADLVKAKGEMEFPNIHRQVRDIWIEPTIQSFEDFIAYYIDTPLAPLISVDIENMGPIITCIGFAPSPHQAIVVPFYDLRQTDRNYWRTQKEELQAWELVKHILATKRCVFQNGLYDMHHLWKTMGIPAPHAAEDTMLLHHAMQPEMNKGLGFLGSVYANEFAWKSMRGEVGTIKGED